MYIKNNIDWKKHIDFIVLNLLCLEIALYIAISLVNGFINLSTHRIYLEVSLTLLCLDFVVSLIMDTFKDVLNRGSYKEFLITLSHVTFMECLTVIYTYALKIEQNSLQETILIFPFIYLFLSYITRLIWKYFVKKTNPNLRKARSLFIISSLEYIEDAIEDVNYKNYGNYYISGIALMNEDYSGKKIQDYDVVTNTDELLDYLCQNWVDEVYIVLNDDRDFLNKLVGKITEMGIVVHIKVALFENLIGQKQLTEKIGNSTVLTTSINMASRSEAILKRMLDIVGGIVGCFITLLLVVIIGPLIYIESPGPIFFTQNRVGKNGKIFKLYKFRSMYMDAEERKAELMKYNKMDDAFMFKLEYDPRIIGSKMMPNGDIKKGIGNFIRDYSLDEFPQFFNVLKGDMSIVGTRPPLIQEVELYDYYHKSRLAMKPGITGVWQVSGRSNITDFDKIVSLDREYINNWTLGLDIKIIFQTIIVVLKKRGAM